LALIVTTQEHVSAGWDSIHEEQMGERQRRTDAEDDEESWRDEVAARFGYLATDLRVMVMRLEKAMTSIEALPPELL
jgi:hypothetical protein